MRALGFDTETTGLIRNRFAPLTQQPHIIELFGLVLQHGKKGWKEASTFHSLFKPPIPITAEITKITGLHDGHLNNAPAFKDKAAEIKQLIEAGDIVFAHNLGFDKAMVEIEMERCGIKVQWPSRMICTVEATEHFRGRRLKLIELHQHLFGEGFENAHRAENDVRPMVRCFQHLWQEGVI